MACLVREQDPRSTRALGVQAGHDDVAEAERGRRRNRKPVPQRDEQAVPGAGEPGPARGGHHDPGQGGPVEQVQRQPDPVGAAHPRRQGLAAGPEPGAQSLPGCPLPARRRAAVRPGAAVQARAAVQTGTAVQTRARRQTWARRQAPGRRPASTGQPSSVATAPCTTGTSARRRHGHRTLPWMRCATGGRLVVLLEPVEELQVRVRPPVHQRAPRVLHDRDDVLAAERLVRLQRVREAQHLGPVVAQQPFHPPQQRRPACPRSGRPAPAAVRPPGPGPSCSCRPARRRARRPPGAWPSSRTTPWRPCPRSPP